jgi:hypothetical protein
MSASRIRHNAASVARLSRSRVRVTSRQTCSRDWEMPRSASSGHGVRVEPKHKEGAAVAVLMPYKKKRWAAG